MLLTQLGLIYTRFKLHFKELSEIAEHPQTTSHCLQRTMNNLNLF